jgi:tetratricopeptide (TPR) repeat protein
VYLLFGSLLALATPPASAPPITPAPAKAEARFVRLVERSTPPQRALARTVDELVAARVERASQLQRQERYGEALAELAAARRRVARAREAGLAYDASALDERHANVLVEAARHRVTQARQATDEGHWVTALAHLDAAAALQHDEPGARAALHEAWAAALVAAGDRREAAEHLALAARADPTEARIAAADDAVAGVAAAERARGDCAAAARILAFAHQPDLRAEADGARACAATGVRVRVRAEIGPRSKGLAEKVERALREAVTAADVPLWALDSDQASTRPGAEGPAPRGPLQLDVTLRVATVHPGQAERRLAHGPVQGAVGAAGPVWMSATWEVFEQPLTVQLEAEVEVDDAGTGRVGTTRMVTRATRTASWAGHVLGYTVDSAFHREATQVVWGEQGDPRARRDGARAREDATREALHAAAELLGRQLYISLAP